MVRIFRLLKDIWILVVGMAFALRTLCWVVVMVFLFGFIYAVAALILIRDGELKEIPVEYIDVHWSTLFRCMMSLLQLMTLDEWADLVRLPVVLLDRVRQLLLILLIGGTDHHRRHTSRAVVYHLQQMLLAA